LLLLFYVTLLQSNLLKFTNTLVHASENVKKNTLSKEQLPGSKNYKQKHLLLESDADSDSMSDKEEGYNDTDSDSIPDFRDLDSDNDDIPDKVEKSVGGGDSDSDGIPNEKDTDSVDTDTDGFETEYVDTNGDGRLTPEELDAKEDYRHLLCLDTNQDDLVTKGELQLAWKDYRCTELSEFSPTDMVAWIESNAYFVALKSQIDSFQKVGGFTLFEHVIQKPYQVRTKLKLDDDAVGELRLAVCDAITSAREERIKQNSNGVLRDDVSASNASTLIYAYTGLQWLDWFLDKTDRLPWWSQGMLLTISVILCTTWAYLYEKNQNADKRKQEKEKRQKDEEKRNKKRHEEETRRQSLIENERKRREQEAMEEQNRTRKPRARMKTIGKLRSITKPLRATSSASTTPSNVAQKTAHGSATIDAKPKFASLASSSFSEFGSSAAFDKVPIGLNSVHRTTAGLIPYENVHFRSFEKQMEFSLDGIKEYTFSVPPSFRTGIYMRCVALFLCISFENICA
jgi:hypothetical protein